MNINQLVLTTFTISISTVQEVNSIQFFNPKAAWQRCICNCNADSDHGLHSLPYVNTETLKIVQN